MESGYSGLDFVKRILTLLFVLSFASPSFAQLPQNLDEVVLWMAGKVKPLAPLAVSPTPGQKDVKPAVLYYKVLGAQNCDVYFGTVNPPVKVQDKGACGEFTISALEEGKKYYWKVVGRNTAGSMTGPVWSFTTAEAPPPPPPPIETMLEVQVFDGPNWDPLVGARVTRVSGDYRDTDGSGYVNFGLVGDPDTLTITKTGYVTIIVPVPPGRHQFHLVREVPPREIRTGINHLCNHAFCDDGGAYPALGATLFWAHNGYRTTPDQLNANLAWVKDELGADYIRALGMVGIQPWWEGRVIDPKSPDYWTTVVSLTQLAYRQYGLRVQWTLFGDGQVMLPDKAERQAYVEKFADVIADNGLAPMVFGIELANEYWQNGFSDTHEGRLELRDLARRLDARLASRGIGSIPIALSTPVGVAGDSPTTCDETKDLYAGSAADYITDHFSRETRLIDGPWRHVRQPWGWDECGIAGLAASNNEPMGPGSSVAEETNPERIVAAYLTSEIAGVGAYVYHSNAGIWGGVRGVANLWEEVNAGQIASALRAARRNLPGDLANGRRTRHGLADFPFLGSFGCGTTGCAQIWPDGSPTGVVRIYATQIGNDFYANPIGIRGNVRLTPTRAVSFDVLNPRTMDVLAHYELNPGETATLGGEFSTVLIRGHYR